MKKKSYILIGVLNLIMISYLQALVVGSDTAVSRQAFVTFPQVDSNNTMLGFAAFENGFSLESYKTTCTFDAFFPIDTLVNLNGGLVWLARDLQLAEGTELSTIGEFAGDSKSLQVTTTVTLTIPSGDPSSTLLLNFITAQSFGAGAGNAVRSFDWTFNDRFIATGSQSSPQLRVFSFDGMVLTLQTSLALGIAVGTLRAHPFDYYIALGTLASASDELRVYRFDPSGPSLTLIDSVNYGEVRTVTWHPTGIYLAALRASPDPEITIYSFISDVLTPVATANITPDSDVRFDVMGFNGDGSYLAVGTFDTDTLYVYSFDGSSLTEVASAVTGGSGIAAVDWSPVGPYIALGLNLGTQRIRVYEFDADTNTLTDLTSAYVDESTAAVQDVAWKSDGSALAIGRIAGAGTDFRTYYFDSALTLTLIGEFDIPASVTFVHWSRNGAFVAEGDSVSQLGVYLGMATGANDELILTNIKTSLFSDIVMQKNLRFKGNCTLNGMGRSIYLDEESDMVLDTGASVLLQNVTIENVKDHKIRCLDSFGAITLLNSQLMLSDNYTFTQGSFIFSDDVLISGTHIFSYESAQQSTILQYSTLLLDEGVTFSYSPPSNNRNLLAMIDATSQFYLRGASLQSTTTGLTLTHGTLVIENNCPVLSAAQLVAEGIMLGGGAAASELTIKLLPDSSFDVISGFLVYNNLS